MKAINSILSLTLLFSSSAFSQNENGTTKKRIFVEDTYVAFGSFSTISVDGSFADLQKLAPNSLIIPDDPSTYDISSRGSNFTGSSFNMSFGLAFRNKDGSEKSNNLQLRVGFNFNDGMASSASWFKEDRFIVDTVVSQRDGRSFPVDSVSSKSFGYDYEYSQARLDLALIYRTNQESRWSAFAGVGLSAGLSIRSNTYLYSYENNYLNWNDEANGFPWGEYSNYRNDNPISQTIRNEQHTAVFFYSMLGINFRLADEHPFWKKVHLHYELRPGIDVLSTPQLGTITSVSFQNGIGLRISI